MKQLLIFSAAVIVVVALSGVAQANLVPPWRGEAGSTLQGWNFGSSIITPQPQMLLNPYGDPLLKVTPAGNWISEIDGRQGVWPLSGEIDVYIPNLPEPNPLKYIWVQVTWKPAEYRDIFLPDEPIVGVAPFDVMTTGKEQLQLPEGWVQSTFKITIEPNPPEEWITVKGNVLVDELVIDTICIPEPATICLLGLGGLVTLLRRKR